MNLVKIFGAVNVCIGQWQRSKSDVAVLHTVMLMVYWVHCNVKLHAAPQLESSRCPPISPNPISPKGLGLEG